MSSNRLAAVQAQAAKADALLLRPLGRGRYERPEQILLDQPTGVYVISDGEFVKIGAACDPVKRLATLQVGNARKLTLLHFANLPRPYAVEAALHAQFQERRVRGEWFNVAGDVAVAALLDRG